MNPMRFVDTNILLRYCVADDASKSTAVLELLERVERNEEKILVSPLVIFETIFTLQSFYRVPRKRIRELLLPILSLRGLRLSHQTVFASALELFTRRSISFADAFNACFMKEHGLKEIYSYDSDFDTIEGIERVVP